jgi:hypothetical protein
MWAYIVDTYTDPIKRRGAIFITLWLIWLITGECVTESPIDEALLGGLSITIFGNVAAMVLQGHCFTLMLQRILLGFQEAFIVSVPRKRV